MQATKTRTAAARSGILYLRTDELQPNPVQPRTVFDETALAELADALAELADALAELADALAELAAEELPPDEQPMTTKAMQAAMAITATYLMYFIRPFPLFFLTH